MSHVYCLMVTGGSLTDDVHDVLFDAAQAMCKRGQRKRRVRGDWYEGKVWTKFRYARIGGIAGVVFHAVVETKERAYRVNYVVRPARVHSSQVVWEMATADDFESGDPSLN